MNFNEYRPLALRTAKPLPTRRDDLRHACLGFITEIGEFVSEVKRIVIYEKIMSTEMRAHMLEELGDAMWYVPTLMKSIDSEVLPELQPQEIDEIIEGSQNLGDAALLLSGIAAMASAYYVHPNAFDAHDMRRIAATLVLTIERCAELLGSSGSEIRAANIEKLRKRFPDAYSNAAAEARADKGGADHRIS